MRQIIEFTVLPIALGGVYLAVLIGLWKRPAGGSRGVEGYDAAGLPIYRVVGHRADGTVITANQIPGYHRARLNRLALITLVLGLTVPPLAVAFGHVARAQIRMTGERGDYYALAGLLLGYLNLLAFGVFGLLLVAAMIL